MLRHWPFLFSPFRFQHQRPTVPLVNPRPMEFEVKLKLPNSAAHQKVLSILSPAYTQTLHQLNIFYNGPAGELSSRRANLSLRFCQSCHPPICFICLKDKAAIVDGVCQVEQDCEAVDYGVGFQCLEDPTKTLGEVNSRVAKRAKEEFGVEKFLVLGGYRNVRNVHQWNGVKLEVDETVYDFGTCYEIECETPEPEMVMEMIEGFLNEFGIEYSYSEMSKFAIFRSGKLPDQSSSLFENGKQPNGLA